MKTFIQMLQLIGCWISWFHLMFHSSIRINWIQWLIECLQSIHFIQWFADDDGWNGARRGHCPRLRHAATAARRLRQVFHSSTINCANWMKTFIQMLQLIGCWISWFHLMFHSSIRINWIQWLIECLQSIHFIQWFADDDGWNGARRGHCPRLRHAATAARRLRQVFCFCFMKWINKFIHFASAAIKTLIQILANSIWIMNYHSLSKRNSLKLLL